MTDQWDQSAAEAAWDGDRQSKLREAAVATEKAAPDAFARATELGRRMDVPASVVADTPQEFEQEDYFRRLDEFQQRHPKAAEFIADPNKMPLVKDDLDATGGFSESLTRLWNSIKGPPTQTVGGLIQEFGELNPWKLVRDYIRSTGAMTYAPPGAIPPEVLQGGAASDMIAEKGADIADFGAAVSAEGFKGLHHPESVGEALQNPRNAAEYYANLIAQSGSAQLPSALLGFVDPALALGGIAVTTQGQQYAQDRAAGVDEASALKDANVSGALEALGELLPFHYLFGKGGGSLFGKVARAYPAEMLSEAFTQAAQDESTVHFTGETMTPQQRMSSILDAMIASAGQVTPHAVVAGAVHIAEQRANTTEARRMDAFRNAFNSANEASLLSRVMQSAQEWKLPARDPQAASDFVEHMLGEQAQQNVYIPSSEFTTLFQNPVVDADRLTGQPGALAIAGESGDIAIPLSRFVAEVSTLPNAEDITRVARLRPEGLSRAQIESGEHEFSDDEAKHDEALRQEIEGLTAATAAQIESTGRYTSADAGLMAGLHARYMGTLAQRIAGNNDPVDTFRTLAARFPLRVSGEATGSTDTLAKNTAPQPAVSFEVAPDPNDAELTAEWNSLSPDRKTQISHTVARTIVPEVLRKLGVNGRMFDQLGGYEDYVNPSFSLVIDDVSRAVDVAKLLGFALSQDSMVVVSPEPAEGLDQVGVVTIDIPDGTDVEALYAQLREIEVDGQKPVSGFSASNGQMAILNFSDLDTKALADLIHAKLGPTYTVADDVAYSAFPEKKDYGYDSNQPGQAAAGAPVQSGAGQGGSDANAFREQATAALRSALDADRQALTLDQAPAVSPFAFPLLVSGQYDTAQQGPNGLTGRAAEIYAQIPQFPGLTPEQRAVEERARMQVALDPEKAVADYRALKGTQNGRVVSADEAREIFPDYNASADARSANAVSVHEPASWVAKEVYRQELERPVSLGRQPVVAFTAGGTGAGKTSGRSRLPEVKQLVDDEADIIYDGNLQSVGSAVDKFGQALAKGRDVMVLFTGRDMHQSFFHGTVPRAENPGYGRTVPIPVHVGTHVGSAKTFLALKKQFGDDPRFHFLSILNDFEKGGKSAVRMASDEDIAALAAVDRDTMEGEIRRDFDHAYQQGNVSERVYHGTLGTRPEEVSGSAARGEGEDQRLDGEVRQGDQGPQALNQNPAESGVFDADITSLDLHPDGLATARSKWAWEPEYRHANSGPIALERRADGTLHVLDGYHRIEQARRDGATTIKAKVVRTAVQTETPEFKAWFGDSKVVNPDGTPMVVYHGSRSSFDTFKRGDFEPGMHFGTRNQAHNDSFIGRAGLDSGLNAQLYPVYLSIQNPVRLRDKFGRGRSEDMWWAVKDSGVLSDAAVKELEMLSPELAGTKAAPSEKPFWERLALLLEDAGYDGIVYENRGEIENDERPKNSNDYKYADSWVAFRPEQVKSAIANSGAFDPNNPSILHAGPQGQYDRLSDTITLFSTADRSTFFHEMAHHWLDVMAELVNDPDTPQSFRDDWAKILDFLGVKDASEIGRDQHEAWARSFELYLREGKAPAPELVRPFARFARWLTDVYRNVKTLLEAGAKELTPDIRGVMDRMLAVDDEIALVEAQQAHGPLVTAKEAAGLGLSPAQWQVYADMLEAATDEARRSVTAQVLKALDRERKAGWREERAGIRADLLARLEATPTFKAWRALQAGDKLDLGFIRERFTPDEQRVLRGLNIARNEGGVHPDLVAESYGFDSGDAMLRALLGVRAQQRAVQEAVEAEMQARHPDPVEDGLTERVTKALYGSKRLAVLEYEVAMLARLAGQQAPAPGVLRAAARAFIAGKTVRSLRPHDSLVAERKAAREATKAAAAGDYAKALQFKREQARHAALYSEARRAQDRATRQLKALRKAGKPSTIKRIGKAGKGYVDALRAILDGFELAPVSGKVVARRGALREWVRTMQEAGASTAVTDAILARVESERVTNIADLTVGELGDLAEAVKNLLHLAAVKSRLQTARGEIEWEDAKVLLIARLEQDKPTHGLGVGDPDLRQAILDGYAAGANWVLQPETLIEWLDGGTSGPWHDLLWEPSEQAEHNREALQARVGAMLEAAMNQLTDEQRKALDDRHAITSLGETVNGHYILSALLNMGNEGNRDKLTRGGFVRGDKIEQFTPDQLAEMFSKLSRPQAELVQHIWDAVNSLWPDIVQLAETVSGFAPEKVEAKPVTIRTKDGPVTLRGGYFPAMYDPRGAKAGQFAEDEAAKKLIAGQTPVVSYTSKGHEEKRTDYAAPLLLDYHAVLSRHLSGVMSDIAYRRFLAQAYKVLGDTDLARMIDNRVGKGATRGLRHAFERGAVGTAGLLGPMAQYFGPFQNLASATMTNVAAAALGLRVPLSMANIVTAPILAVARVAPKFLVRGFVAYYSDMGKQAEMIRRMSPMMLQRTRARTTDYHAMLESLRGKRGLRMRMIELSMSVHQWIVPLAENAIWLSAYMQAQSNGADVTEAIRMADKAIRQTQTKHTAKDLSNAESGWLRPLMMFAGPMVVINNRLQEAGLRGMRGAVESPTQALAAWIAMAAGGSWLFELMMGRGPDDDDDDGLDVGDWAWWMARKLGFMPFGAFPILRDVTQNIESGFGGGNPLTEAALRLYQFGKLAVKSGVAAFEGDEVDEQKLAGKGLDAVGVMTGLPTTQAKKTGTYLMEVGTGQHTPKNPAKEAYYLVQGPPKTEE